MFNKLALGLISGLAVFDASAQSLTNIQLDPRQGAYAQDSRGAVTRSGTGLCWRTGYWSAEDSVSGCDGDLVSPMAKPTAPDLNPSTSVAASAPLIVAPQTARRCDFTMSVSSDDSFSFGKATLSAAAGLRLERDFRQQLAQCGNVESINITGYTDSLGLASINQRLSQQRAAAVAARLQNTVAQEKVTVIGMGSTQKTTSCSDTLPRAILLACLAPDRRAIIAVRGEAR
ncbi:OmpA family protein [Actimicrobium antarcticum]|uniref:OmpA family protein n=1 Tax=Actimicrobium antarcticum TaxID=1051899 RepID=A0ABP7TDY6_9BURK